MLNYIGSKFRRRVCFRDVILSSCAKFRINTCNSKRFITVQPISSRLDGSVTMVVYRTSGRERSTENDDDRFQFTTMSQRSLMRSYTVIDICPSTLVHSTRISIETRNTQHRRISVALHGVLGISKTF